MLVCFVYFLQYGLMINIWYFRTNDKISTAYDLIPKLFSFPALSIEGEEATLNASTNPASAWLVAVLSAWSLRPKRELD